MSLHSNKKLTKTEIETREHGIAVTGLPMLCIDEIGKTLERWARKSVESIKPKGTWKNNLAKSNVDYDCLAQKVSEGKTIREYPKDHFCDI